MSGLLVLGAGGHGRVVAETAYDTGKWDRIAFLDDYLLESQLGLPILGKTEDAVMYQKDYPDAAVAIGNNALRINILNKLVSWGFHIPPIIHPTAFISRSAQIGLGTVVFPQCAVNTGAKIGRGCIINTSVSIDHDCLLGQGVHLSPGVHLAGEVKIGDYCWLGTGSSVIHQISCGENVIVGAGTVIINHVDSNVTIVGNPGRIIKKNE